MHRLEETLAHIDPHDLAQAIERHVATLDGATIRALVAPVLSRTGKNYRDELAFLLNPALTDAAARRALERFLQSNIRAIPYFDPVFAADLLDACPTHRVAAIGDVSRRGNARAMLFVGTAIALVLLGAAAEHAVSSARAAAQGSKGGPLSRAHRAATRTPGPAQHRIVVASPAREPTPAAVEAPLPSLRPPPAYDPAPLERVVPSWSAGRPVRRVAPARLASKAGAGTVTIAATPAPNAQPSPLDANDMPQSYSDATPLVAPSTAQADVSSGRIAVPTPAPTDKPRHGWFKHLDPFQPGAHIRIP